VGPLPLLFSTATPSALFGSLFGLLRHGSAVKKEKKVKNGQMLIGKEEPGLIAFDHFFEFGIPDRGKSIYMNSI
jgi:hypothetical protein